MSEQPPYTESELVELVRSIDVRAPERLHSQIQALIDEHSARRRSPWARLIGAPIFAGSATRRRGGGGRCGCRGRAGACAERHRLGWRDADAAPGLPLTLRAATMTAPAQSATHPSELAASVEGVAFPYWEDHFGWRASGARVDHVDGRMVTTVFYTDASHQRIGYAIVAGTPAPPAGAGIAQWRDGTPYRYVKENGAWLVTWLRDGHRCIVSDVASSGPRW